MDLKQLAKRKLEEFHRWCRVSSLFHEQTESFDNWLIPSLEFNPEDYKDRKHDWQREAPEEVNEIIKAVNSIPYHRQRAILIMCYIATDTIRPSEQYQRIGIKSSTYYLAKNKALEEFASQYRSGILERYRGG
ncbi:ArpU family phage packaging/lysis transcriptional regulator [Streptococcus suis]